MFCPPTHSKLYMQKIWIIINFLQTSGSQIFFHWLLLLDIYQHKKKFYPNIYIGKLRFIHPRTLKCAWKFGKNYNFPRKARFSDFLLLATCTWCQTIPKKDSSRDCHRKTASYPDMPSEMYAKMRGWIRRSLPKRILRWIFIWCYLKLNTSAKWEKIWELNV